MLTSLNRRELLTFAAAAGAAAITLPAMAQTALTAPETPTATPSTPAPAASLPDTTQEGIALVSAAYAAAGFPLPDDQIAEIRKQLSGYPGDFAKARKFVVENGDAPAMDVTQRLPKRANGNPQKRKILGVTV